MLLNRSNLATLYDGFNAAFTKGYMGAQPAYKTIAMVVPSAADTETYGWLGQFPRMQEWVGRRAVQNLAAHSYAVKNRRYHNTVAVARTDIEDDRYGVFSPIMAEMGRAAAEHPDELIFSLLKTGFETPCYDGQNFFDADHPVVDETGETVSVSNTGGGSGAAWFLLDTSRVIKPMLYQERIPYKLTQLTDDGDDNVFWNDEFIYGVRARSSAGFGLWQLAYGSKQTLDATNYAAARAALMNVRGDAGRPLGVKPNLLVVPPALESAGRKIINSELGTGGETNEWKNTADLLVTPWLA